MNDPVPREARRAPAEASGWADRRLDAVLNATPDLVYVFDLEHRFVYANKALLAMWGRAWDDAIGKNCLELGYQPWHAEMHDREIDQVIKTKQPVRGEVPFTGTLGRRIYDYIFVPVFDARGRVEAVAGTTRDVTDTKRTQSMISGQSKALELAVQSAPIEQVLHELLLIIEDQSEDKAMAMILLMDREGRTLRHGASPTLPGEFRDGIDALAVGPDAPTPGAAAFTAHPLTCADIQSSPAWAGLNAVTLRHGITSCWSTPILSVRGRVLGTFDLYNRSSAMLTPTEVESLNFVTRTAAVVIERHAEIIERRIAEEATERAIERQATLLQVTRLILEAADVGPSLTCAIFDKVQGILDADACLNYRLDADGAGLQLVAAPGLPAEQADLIRHRPLTEPYCGAAAATSVPAGVVVADIATQPRGALLHAMGYRSCVCHPLLASDGGTLGTLCFASVRRASFSAEESDFIQTIAHFLSLAWERARSVAALRDSEDKFRNLADSMSQLAWIADDQGSTLWVNRRWLDYAGEAADRLLGRAWHARIHPDHADRVDTGARRARETGGPWEDTFPLRGADGRHRWFLARAQPVRDRDGRIVRWFGTSTDITEQKLVEIRRTILLDNERAARAEAERIGRVKDEFLSILSHELRTPLGVILMWTHLLRGASTPESVAEGLDVIERSALQQTHLVSDLLDMGRIAAGKLSLEINPLDISVAVYEALDLFRQPAAEKNITLETAIETIERSVCADTVRLQQIISNILANAVKFTPRGGRITVRVHETEHDAVIEVQDTGRGMTPDFIHRLFQRFQQADSSSSREHGGLGLGLALVKELTALHNGSVHAVSHGPDQGSTFIVKLPLTSDAATPPGADPCDPTDADASSGIEGLAILVLDDEPDTLETIARILESFGAVVTRAHAANEALHELDSAPFDLIVSDIGMPGKDGYAFIREARSLDISVPALALTAYAHPNDRTRAMKAGFQDHLAKPVEPRTLVAVLNRLSLAALAQTARCPPDQGGEKPVTEPESSMQHPKQKTLSPPFHRAISPPPDT